MCGINGFNWRDESLVQKMNEATKHRGPDGTHCAVGEGFSLGHNRLSIIDIAERADQPMWSFDRRYVIVYNGELYNFKELKKDIGKRYPFVTESDTEVVLAAYGLWGEDCVKKFNGMFAFAIFDTQNKSFFLARDQMGIKSLHYFFDGTRFIFSSEMKGLFAHTLKRILDEEALALYLRLLYVPQPCTLVKNIKTLPPGHTLLLTGKQLSCKRYYCAQETVDISYSMEKAADTLLRTTTEAVQRQMVSDRPVGIFLSGGLDASAILAAAAGHTAGIGTYTIGYDLEGHSDEERFNIDAQLAKKSAEFFGAKHSEVKLRAREIPDLLLQAAQFVDIPVPNPTIPAMLKLSNIAAKEVAVVMNGGGGDELWGGYVRYQKVLPFARVLQLAPNTLSSHVSARLYERLLFEKKAVASKMLQKQLPLSFARALYQKRYFSSGATGEHDFVRLFMNCDRDSWLVDQSHLVTDRTSMAYGLEARVPLLDIALVALAGSVPTHCKVTRSETKKVVREAYAHVLPQELLTAKKRGWISPGAKWLRDESVYAFFMEVLSPNFYAPTKGLFNFETLRYMLEEHKEGRGYYLLPVWSAATLQLWAREHAITQT